MAIKIKIILLLLFIFSPYTYLKAETLKAGTLQFPPYSYATSENGVDGLSVALVRYLAHQLKLDIEVRVYPWPRALYLAKKGQIDMLFTAYRTSEREDYLEYGEQSLLEQEVSLFVRKESDFISVEDFLSKKMVKVGLRRGISYGSIIDGILEREEIPHSFVANDDKTLLKMLNENRVDAIPLNRLVAQYYINQGEFLIHVKELAPPVQSVPSYLTFSKKSPYHDLIKKFDAALLAFKKSGDYEKFVAKWLMENAINTPQNK